jgi:hypothetical protein
MGLAELQCALARLYVDAKLRQRFFADPEAVGAELGLDAGETRDLAGVSRRQVEQYADSLRRKRQDQVCRIIPMAAKALGERFAKHFGRYVAESAPRGSKAGLDDAVAFVKALDRWAVPIEPPWAADLARFELAWRQAARAGRVPIVRLFRFPVARLALGEEALAPRASLALWWRPTRRGPIRHFVITMPRLSIKRG